MTTRGLLLALLLTAAGFPAAARAEALPPGDDIRDIRPAFSIPAPRPKPPWLAIAGGAVGLAALGVVMARRRRPRAIGLAEATLARLEAARKHAAAGDAYGFSVRVSEILRDYLEQRFALRASRQTTPEFLRDLADRHIPELQASEATLDDFLDACDAAKYARYELAPPQMDRMADEARRLVEQGGAA